MHFLPRNCQLLLKAVLSHSHMHQLETQPSRRPEVRDPSFFNSTEKFNLAIFPRWKKPNAQNFNLTTCLTLEVCYSFPYRDKRMKWILLTVLNSWNCFQPEEVAWNIRHFRMLHTESCNVRGTEVRQTCKRRTLDVLHKVLN